MRSFNLSEIGSVFIANVSVSDREVIIAEVHSRIEEWPMLVCRLIPLS